MGNSCFVKRPVQQHRPLLSCAALDPVLLHRIILIDLASEAHVWYRGSPVADENLGCDAHWFDGDGMLRRTSFRAMVRRVPLSHNG